MDKSQEICITLCFRKLFRFSDLYTSRVTNLNQYKVHVFNGLGVNSFRNET